MLNSSASASSSNDRNFLLFACLGFAACELRGAAKPDADREPDAPPFFPAGESWKNCCVDESAGLIWFCAAKDWFLLLAGPALASGRLDMVDDYH